MIAALPTSREHTMQRVIANTLTELRSEWASWRTLWSFLVHLNDLDFYKGLDEQREICSAPWASWCGGVSAKRSWPIARVGERFLSFSQRSVEGSGNDSRGTTDTPKAYTVNIFLTSVVLAPPPPAGVRWSNVRELNRTRRKVCDGMRIRGRGLDAVIRA